MPRTTSNDPRPRIDVSKPVKAHLREMQKSLGFKTDSEVISYLMAAYEEKMKTISLTQDIEIRKRATEINEQTRANI